MLLYQDCERVLYLSGGKASVVDEKGKLQAAITKKYGENTLKELVVCQGAKQRVDVVQCCVRAEAASKVRRRVLQNR